MRQRLAVELVTPGCGCEVGLCVRVCMCGCGLVLVWGGCVGVGGGIMCVGVGRRG